MPSLYNLQEVRTTTKAEHRLPWMPTGEEWEEERNLGGMMTRLWEGQELQQLYINELESRIAALEQEATDG
mgnify:FL=1